jgi:hypothetical protein
MVAIMELSPTNCFSAEIIIIISPEVQSRSFSHVTSDFLYSNHADFSPYLKFPQMAAI